MSASNDLGRVTLSPSGPVEAGGYGMWEFNYVVGERGIGPGGSVEFVFNSAYPTNTWSVPQIADGTADGFVTARTTGAARLTVEVVPVPPALRRCSLAVHVVRVNVGEPGLKGGDEVVVAFGDRAMGSRGAMAQYMGRRVEFPVYVATDVHEKKIPSACDWFKTLARIAPVRTVAHFLPALEVRGGQVGRLEVVGPSVVAVGEEFSMTVVALDRFWNKASRFGSGVRGQVVEGDVEGLRQEYEFSPDGRVRVGGLRAKRPCICYVGFFDTDSGASGISNPILVEESPPQERLYWGEIHAHTELSDGNGTPEEHYEYARDVALLDFAALADHIYSGDAPEAKWETSKKATDAFNAAGKFVTLQGYEAWFGPPGNRYAHTNVYFPDGSVPYLPAERPKEEVWKEVLRYGGILVPHHTGYGRPGMRMNDWEAFRWEGSPVAEIFSAHGNSEAFDAEKPLIDKTPGSFVQDALERGLKLGFVGGSDYHQAFVGSRIRLEQFPANLNASHFQYRAGYTGVFARELSRDAVYQAICSRSCYATTGGRMIILARMNGEKMGRVVAGDDRRLEVFAAGEGSIERVEVIKNNKVVYAEEPGALWTKVEFRDGPGEDEDFYYVRVRQRDGELGWSSPVWVKRG